MDDLYFTDRDLIVYVYNSYIEGLSVEEIMVRVNIFKELDLSFEMINSIIDDVNLIFV